MRRRSNCRAGAVERLLDSSVRVARRPAPELTRSRGFVGWCSNMSFLADRHGIPIALEITGPARASGGERWPSRSGRPRPASTRRNPRPDRAGNSMTSSGHPSALADLAPGRRGPRSSWSGAGCLAAPPTLKRRLELADPRVSASSLDLGSLSRSTRKAQRPSSGVAGKPAEEHFRAAPSSNRNRGRPSDPSGSDT